MKSACVGVLSIIECVFTLYDSP